MIRYESAGIPATAAEADVVQLWNRRAARANDALFRWGYLSSPVGTGQCFLLRAIDGDTSSVVGSVGMGARRVDAGGETLSAGVLGDFFVLKAHRTFFPALSIQRAALDWGRKNLDLVYGFPNDSARPVFERLGFRRMALLRRHVLVLRHARYIAPRVRSRIAGHVLAAPIDGFRRFIAPGISRAAPHGLELRRFERLDDRFDRLFRARAFRDFTVGHRDAKLLQWRFLECPERPCLAYGLTDGSGELRAYVVVDVVGDVAHVRDLLGVDLVAMAHALRLVGGVMRRDGCAALSFQCAAPPALSIVLERLGFRVRDAGGSTRTLYGHAGDNVSDADVLSALDRWYVTEADEDQ